MIRFFYYNTRFIAEQKNIIIVLSLKIKFIIPMHAPVLKHDHRFLLHIAQLALVSDLCSAHFPVYRGV